MGTPESLAAANERLAELLARHGVPSALEDNWIVSGRAGVPIRCVGETMVGQPSAAALHVELALPDGRLLRQEFGGGGTDEQSASRAVWLRLASVWLHPVLASFFAADEPADCEDVSLERIDVGGTEWLLCHGRVAFERWDVPSAEPPGGRDLREPEGLWTTLRRFVATRAVFDGPKHHWLDVYYHRHRFEPPVADVRWDNERWP